MKKLLVSLGAILSALPMVANGAVGDPVPGDPGNTVQNGSVATATPKYELQSANPSVDGIIATAGYVKGAYNAAIKGVNKVHDEVTSATTDFNTAVQSMANTYATKAGVLATINNATTTGTIDAELSNGSFTNATLTDASVTGTATPTISAMTTWDSNTPGTLEGVTASLNGVTVSGNISGSIAASVTGTTAGTISAPNAYQPGTTANNG